MSVPSLAAARPPVIDLHTHSTVSDGTDSPAELVAAAAAAGLDVMGLTDHDTFDGLAEAEEAGRRLGVEVLAGAEISTTLDGVTVHLLAYGCDTTDEPLLTELARLRGSRHERLARSLERLAALGMPLTADEVMAQVGRSPSLGRPHLADALVAKGYVADRTEAFERFLHDGGPAYVERYSTPLPDALRLVRGARGVAVIAHPWGRGSRRVLTEDVIASLVADGLDGLEAAHTDHDAEAEERLARLAAGLGLLATGSSDHHGTGKRDNALGVRTTSPEVYGALVDLIRARGGRLPV